MMKNLIVMEKGELVMAIINKCDRCGKVYETNLVVPAHNIYNRERGMKVDLCESCQESFNAWFACTPIDIKITAPAIDWASIDEYHRDVAKMANCCGAKYSR